MDGFRAVLNVVRKIRPNYFTIPIDAIIVMNYISFHYRQIALLYAELGDAEHTLEALKENCRYSVMEATLQDMNYTAPMINRVQHKQADTSKNYTGNCCNISLETLKKAKRFDFVRDTEEFQKMVTELKRYAE